MVVDPTAWLLYGQFDLSSLGFSDTLLFAAKKMSLRLLMVA